MIRERILPVIWIVTTVLFIGFVPLIGADVNAASNENDWVPTNGPYGGHIDTLYVTPEGVLFAGVRGAGVFRSADLGDSWIPVNVGLPFEPGEGYLSASVFAQKGGTLYAGSVGLYASTDGGDTWNHVPTLQTYMSVSGVVIIGNRIYISTLEDGVWYSDDDGDSWIPMNDGLENMSIREFSRIGTTLVAGTENGAFRKKAHEDSWTSINAGFVEQPMNMEPINSARVASGLDPVPMGLLPSGLRVDSFAAMENMLYIGILIGGDSGESGFFRSDDEGDTWTRITTEEMTHTVEALASFGTTLYASTFGGGVFCSEDSGDSWTTVNDGLTDQTVSALLAVSEDTVFVGTLDGGVFRTTDGGNSWVEANTGLMGTSVSELEVVGDRIYAGIGHRLVYSIDGGESWQPVQIPPPPISYHFSALSEVGGKLYVAATRFAPGDVVGGIFQVDEVRNSLIEVSTDRELYAIECMEIVGLTFYVGTQGSGVFRWTPGLDSWESLGLEGHFITALSVNGKKIHAGTPRGEIFRLEKTGKSWKSISSDMSDSFISDLKWVGSTLYAATWGKGIFRSTNDGNSWTSLHYGLGDSSSVITMETAGTESYVGTYYKGVFQWIEDNKWWKPIGSLRRRVDSLAVLDGFLYAGTTEGGVLRISIKE
ncbi:MAG: hypothetical protein OYL97_17990 [Candidatus Poribacteria bacterium]|nr:hypothetical protein [Candidatus Poribacteria bacterium]